MTASIHESTDANRQRVVLERAFSAPRELVFSLFQDPVHLARWWCPYPLTFPVCEFDARPGGSLRFVLQTSDGTRFPSIGTVLEVDPPKRLVFTTRRESVEPGSTQMEVQQTVTFTERGNQTVIRVQIDVLQANETTPQTLDGMEIGWMQDFGKLEFYLLPLTDAEDVNRAGTEAEIRTPSNQEIVMSRTFNAPRALIFKAITGPELVRGEYFLIESPELVVNSFELEQTAGQIVIDAVHLFERNETTLLTNIALYPSKAERDKALDAGVARRTIERYERLEDVLRQKGTSHGQEDHAVLVV
jgi:uncharacterized protein YndB with AHSA1/START domain